MVDRRCRPHRRHSAALSFSRYLCESDPRLGGPFSLLDDHDACLPAAFAGPRDPSSQLDATWSHRIGLARLALFARAFAAGTEQNRRHPPGPGYRPGAPGCQTRRATRRSLGFGSVRELRPRATGIGPSLVADVGGRTVAEARSAPSPTRGICLRWLHSRSCWAAILLAAATPYATPGGGDALPWHRKLQGPARSQSLAR